MTETLQQQGTPDLECCVLWWRWSREESFSSWPACWPVAAAAAVCCTMMMTIKRTMIRDPHTAVYWVAHHASLTQPLAHSELTALWFHLAHEKNKNNKHHSKWILLLLLVKLFILVVVVKIKIKIQVRNQAPALSPKGGNWNNTIQLYCLCVEKFAFWLIVYIKHLIHFIVKHSTIQ